MEIDVKLLIKRIDESVAKAGLTKTEFYKRSGISSASFSQWKTGVHKPALKKIFSAAETLRVEPDYLLGRIDEPNPSPKSENGKIVLYVPKLTPEEKKAYMEWDEEETYKAAKQLVERVEDQKQKSPAPEGAELTKERIQMLLDRMSAADLVELMGDVADALKRRGAE